MSTVKNLVNRLLGRGKETKTGSKTTKQILEEEGHNG